MKNFVMAIFPLLFSLRVVAGGADSPEETIETLCHCVNDCDREKKCEWIWDKYISLSSRSSSIGDLKTPILRQQKLSLLEMVDSGGFGCFTSFGLYEGKYIRTDVEVMKSEATEVKILVEDVSLIPSLSVRKAADSDDLCLFKFD